MRETHSAWHRCVTPFNKQAIRCWQTILRNQIILVDAGPWTFSWEKSEAISRGFFKVSPFHMPEHCPRHRWVLLAEAH